MEQMNWRKTRDVLLSIICAGIILWAVWSLLGQFVDAIVILILSMAIAFLLTPLANLGEHRLHLPRVVATLLVYLLLLLLFSLFGYTLIITLIQQVLSFSATITQFVSALPQNMQAFIRFIEIQGHIPPGNVQAVLDQVQGQVTDFAKTLTVNAVNFVFILTNAFIDIVVILVLSFYLTLDGKRIRDSLISIVPHRMLPNVRLFEDALSRVVGNYIRGQLTLAFIIGVLTSIVCLFTGLSSYALICGVLAFLFETIPMVGPGLASITPIVLSLLLHHPVGQILLIIACFVVMQLIESNILGPRIVGHAVGLHPVAAILALLIGARLFGVFGALLATPIAAAAWVVVASIYQSARGKTPEQILQRKQPPWHLHRPTTRPLNELPPTEPVAPSSSKRSDE
jgi:predicted PurR-regulated permease PerM